MNVDIDIDLSGENFDPVKVGKLCNVSFREITKKGDWNPRLKRKYKNGYGTLSFSDVYISDSLIDKVVSEYGKIANIGEGKLGIEYKEIWLYVECLQNSFTVNTSHFVKLNKFFPDINITFIQEKGD